jgi:hypothetical protein
MDEQLSARRIADRHGSRLAPVTLSPLGDGFHSALAYGAAQSERTSAGGSTITDSERLLAAHAIQSVETAQGG